MKTSEPRYYSYDQKKELDGREPGWYYEVKGSLYGPYLAKRLAQYAQEHHE